LEEQASRKSPNRRKKKMIKIGRDDGGNQGHMNATARGAPRNSIKAKLKEKSGKN